MPHLFSHIMVKAEQNIPNWILDESSHFTLKSARTFFLNPRFPCGWVNLFGLLIFRLPNSCPLGSFSWAASYRSAYSK